MKNPDKLFWLVLLTIWLMATPTASAQQLRYDTAVNQYCERIGRHDMKCYNYREFNTTLYGGLMYVKTSGNVAGSNNLGGLDLGAKFTHTWGMSCVPVQLQLNGYVDAMASATIDNKESSGKTYPAVYSGQLTITPGLRYGIVSVDCGPYIAYSGYRLLKDEKDDKSSTLAKVDGIAAGLRMGVNISIKKIEIGLHYDMDFTDHKKDFKKSDLLVSVGYTFNKD